MNHLRPRQFISQPCELAANGGFGCKSVGWSLKFGRKLRGESARQSGLAVRTKANGARSASPLTIRSEAAALPGPVEDPSALCTMRHDTGILNLQDGVNCCCAQFFPGREMGPSVGGEEVPLVFVPYMDHLWQRLVEIIPDLRMLPLAPELRLQWNREGAKPARCCNWLLAGDRLRRIRFTYFEAGKAGQAFNALFYPDLRFDLPLLGIDLISLGANKILCVIDFLPLEQDSAYLEKHTHQLVAIRDSFVKHCGRMSSRHFDENQFFSKQLIFYRSELGVRDPILKVPQGELFVVYSGYVEEYIKALHVAVPDEQRLQYVKGRQDAYDLYNAERDPALKLFTTYFGAEWTKTCTEDFLFPGAHNGGPR